ncbi:MAG: hypothetical protein ACYYK0_06000 [Candidatus Eutrophobiaceae bacterium]
MRFILLVLPFLCGITSIFADEGIYKKHRADGSVEFSDRPSIGAEKVELEEPQIIDFQDDLKPPLSKSTNSKNTPAAYTLSIISPVNDQVLYDNSGSFSVGLKLDSSKNRMPHGYVFDLQMNGTTVGTGRKKLYNLQNISRGTHTLVAHLKNAKGEIIASAESVVFHIKRHFKKPAKKPSGSK